MYNLTKLSTWAFILCVYGLLNMTSCVNHIAYVNGQLFNLNGVEVKILSLDCSTAFDSATIKNNKFNLQASLPYEGFYMVVFIGINRHKRIEWKHPCQVYIENNSKCTFYANGPKDILQEFYKTTSTSFNQQKLEEFRSAVNAKRMILSGAKAVLLKKMDRSLSTGQKKAYFDYCDSVKKVDELIANIIFSSRKEFITNRLNHNTVLTPYFISQMGDYFDSYRLYKKILDQLDPSVKGTKYFEQASKTLRSFQNLSVGEKAPIIAGRDTLGHPFNYNFSKHKITLIDFWASYCYPCRENFPKLKLLYNHYKNRGFNIISISIDENKAYWINASLRDSIPWYNVSETIKQENSRNIQNFTVNSIPLNFLLNEKGELLNMNVETDSLDAILSKKLH